MSCKRDVTSFREAINHPALKLYSVDQARELLRGEKPYTYLLVPVESGLSLYLCFLDNQKEFHNHLIQWVEMENGSGWKNGSMRIFKSLDEVIPFSMGVMPGVEISL